MLDPYPNYGCLNSFSAVETKAAPESLSSQRGVIAMPPFAIDADMRSFMESAPVRQL